MDVARRYVQPITYWAILSQDQFGSPSYAAPVTFSGRWVERLLEVQGPKGETIESRTQVHFPQEQPAAINGYVVKGTSIATDPRGVSGAFKIKVITEVPDLRSLHTVKVAVL